MSLSTSEIGSVVTMWRRDLCGGLVQKVISPAAPDRILLELRANRESHLAQLVIAPFFSRLGRVNAKPPRARQPHPFVMLLRKEAMGMVLAEVIQLGGDRAVELRFVGTGRKGRLICELTSRHSNIIWTDGDGLIVGSFHPNRSSRRKLVPGAPYVPPIPREGTTQPGEQRFDNGHDLEQLIERHYVTLEAGRQVEDQRTSVARIARLARRRLTKLLKNLEADRERAREAETLKSRAFVLQANLHVAKRGMETLEAIDFEGAPVTIPLDPSRGPVENMERLFKRAKRLERATPRIDERYEETRGDLHEMTELSKLVPAAQPAELAGLQEKILRRFPDLAAKAGVSKAQDAPRSPFHEFAISNGRTARVGRSAADNDTLTLRHAKPGDLWLHVRGRTGSHVVVPLGRNEDPSSEMLVDAAHLAARYSDAKDDDEVEVTYTRRKYVQKPRGAPPGSVRLLKEKTILLRVDPERLARIMGR